MAPKYDRAKEIYEYSKKNSYDVAALHFALSKETIKRACREFKRLDSAIDINVKDKKSVVTKKAILKSIEEKYSTKELQSIANGSRLSDDKPETPNISFKGDTYKFLFATDSHIGSIYFVEEWFNAAVLEAKKQKVDSVLFSGDLTEGMSNRPGHIYELNKLGYDSQRSYAVEQFKKFDGIPFYACSGNHDLWFVKSSGALIVKDICNEITNGHYLGEDVGNLVINGCKIMMFHGLDSSSYATSYRVQKIVESMSGGEKPNVLLCGHTHKQIYMFERNIQCFSGGCLQKQSGWMRSKRIAAHPGFWIIELTINKGNVAKVNPVWYPFY
jgi:predicted phosphodiesterase